MGDYEIIGPFDTHRVSVGGRRVPFLEAQPMNGGVVSLTLDSRFSLDLSVADAARVIPFSEVPPAAGRSFAAVYRLDGRAGRD